jgi:hypothetical protein
MKYMSLETHSKNGVPIYYQKIFYNWSFRFFEKTSTRRLKTIKRNKEQVSTQGSRTKPKDKNKVNTTTQKEMNTTSSRVQTRSSKKIGLI